VKRRRFKAKAEKLSPDKTGDIMINFIRRRPAYAKSVMKMAGIAFTTEEELRKMAPQWLLLAIHPQR